MTTREVRERKRPAPSPQTPCNRLHAVGEMKPVESLQRANRHARRRSPAEVDKLADFLTDHDVRLPILATADGRVVFGHHILEAYLKLQRLEVPVIEVDGWPDARLKHVEMTLEGYFASGEWDDETVKDYIEDIFQYDPALFSTSWFSNGEIDLFLNKGGKETTLTDSKVSGDNDAVEDAAPVTCTGDVFVWPAGHRLICGNSRLPDTYERLMGGRSAQLLAGDPPYGCSVASISKHHEEWKEGSGMTEEEAQIFFAEFLSSARPSLSDGALIYLFIDWKGMLPLLSAIRSAGLEQKSLCTWNKQAPGTGGFIRNQSEHVVVAKSGTAAHVFNRKAQFNTTIWSVPGYAQFRPDREEALKDHASVKPQGVLIGLLLLASDLGGLVLDPFLGSGSMMLAAQRTRRVCYGIEIEERFVDTAVRRMHAPTGEYPIHEETGLSFDELARSRMRSEPPGPHAADSEL